MSNFFLIFSTATISTEWKNDESRSDRILQELTTGSINSFIKRLFLPHTGTRLPRYRSKNCMEKTKKKKISSKYNWILKFGSTCKSDQCGQILSHMNFSNSFPPTRVHNLYIAIMQNLLIYHHFVGPKGCVSAFVSVEIGGEKKREGGMKHWISCVVGIVSMSSLTKTFPLPPKNSAKTP